MMHTSATPTARPMDAEQRAALTALLNDFPRNAKCLWSLYTTSLAQLSDTQRETLVELVQLGDKHEVLPLEKLSRPFLDRHFLDIKEILDTHGALGAGLVALLGESVLEEHGRFADYLDQLAAQGGISAALTLASTPAGWIPADGHRLVALREEAGVCCLPVFNALRDWYPSGWHDDLERIVEAVGMTGLCLLVRNGGAAKDIAVAHADTLKTLREICVEEARPDAFVGSLQYLTGTLLKQFPNELIALTRTNSAKLPEILRRLKSEHLEQFPGLVFDIARFGRNSIADSIGALSVVAPEEAPLVERLVLRSGIYTPRAVILRGAPLFRDNRAVHEDIISRYGHAYWGLAEQFRESLHEGVLQYRDFIESARLLTHQGAGTFFAHLPREHWNESGLEFAARYREAAGFILSDRRKEFQAIENDPEYRALAEQNADLFNIRWVNRFSRMERGSLNDSLLRQNIVNTRAPDRSDQALALYIAAQTDPNNSFGTKRHHSFLSAVGARAKLFVSEAGDADQLECLMEKVCRDPRYGGSPDHPRKIDLLILAAHSDGFSMQWSGTRHIFPATAAEAANFELQSLTVDHSERIASWNRWLADESVCIPFACSVFNSYSNCAPLGQVLQECLPRTRILGMELPGNIADYEFDDRGMPLRIQWRDGYTWR